ncbi:MAG TPA: hypothetical protein ENF62_02770 [Candidatus Bathyarchaeota archaeon]|nr:hypothetical protein [Candidatus Bathyarchaeota archaeon]
MGLWQAEEVRLTPIRKLKFVVDTEDPTAPAMPLSSFVKLFGFTPEPPRYRLISVDVLSCPEDQTVVLAVECAECPRFIKRAKGYIYCSEKPVR